ncbi:hypothetical protein E3E26_09130 [Thermococcus sp. LS1]|nr:hypothetical protein [Thermococcus sp. LS1]
MPEKWFMVDKLTIIKPYNGTSDVKITITGNESRLEFIPAKNLTPFSISDINWSNLENVTKTRQHTTLMERNGREASTE